MEIVRTLVPESTIEEFAEANNLTMDVRERGSDFRFELSLPRFYACFKNGEITDGRFLTGIAGNGETEADAIADYANKLSEKRLVIRAYHPDRREIQVPRLVAACSKETQ